MSVAAMDGHVTLDDRGVAWVDGANVKVVEIVLDRFAWGWSAEEIHRQYPDLSPAQIHAALAYYFDHQPAFDAEIERSYRGYEARRAGAVETPGRRKLRQLGHLP